jgi:glycerol-3-phosphate dehydrogenase
MDRNAQINAIESTEKWDIIIIGGGATGLGAALDAASRGFKTLCIERFDFSKGTSSRSTKLIHGGVRYLEQGNFNMVKHALQERWFLLKNAPSATQKIPFILPVYSWWRYFYYGLGLMFYDFLSGKFSIGKTRFLNRKAVIDKIPNIQQQSLKGGIRYFDGQFDDSQISIALARTAISKGATVINHMEAESFRYSQGKISGIIAKDRLTGTTHELKCKVVINATGVFADEMMHKDDNSHVNIVSPSQGIHIVVDKEFYPSNKALLIPKTTDGRVLFAVPWHQKVVIGTTDVKTHEIAIEPKATSEEIKFVIDNFNKYTNQHLTNNDVKSVFAGLRPLVKMKNIQSTADLVRDHSIVVSDSGMVTITGGKWTTYRKMARDAVNKALITSELPFRRCKTRTIKLIFAQKQTQKNPKLLHPDFPYTQDDVKHAVQMEMACTLEDVLARRIRLLFLDVKVALEVAPVVGAIMQKELSTDDVWLQDQIKAFSQLAQNYLPDNL